MMRKDLQGCRVLLVEDDFLIADDFARRLTIAGADVIGPAATLAAALALYQSSGTIHAVILDINLRGETVFPLAHRLQQDAVPFLFCTGYGDDPIDADFKSVARFEKPVSHHGFTAMIDLIAQMRDAAPRQPGRLPM
jgi:DNA-binding response OmpR family regulator